MQHPSQADNRPLSAEQAPQLVQEAESVPINRDPVPPIPEAPVVIGLHQALLVAELVYKWFCRQYLLAFDGSIDPILAEDWINKI